MFKHSFINGLSCMGVTWNCLPLNKYYIFLKCIELFLEELVLKVVKNLNFLGVLHHEWGKTQINYNWNNHEQELSLSCHFMSCHFHQLQLDIILFMVFLSNFFSVIDKELSLIDFLSVVIIKHKLRKQKIA